MWELHAKANQGKKRGGKGWQSKKQCWHTAQAEWLEMRRIRKQAERKRGDDQFRGDQEGAA
jgi:hypothetical protein